VEGAAEGECQESPGKAVLLEVHDGPAADVEAGKVKRGLLSEGLIKGDPGE